VLGDRLRGQKTTGKVSRWHWEGRLTLDSGAMKRKIGGRCGRCVLGTVKRIF